MASDDLGAQVKSNLLLLATNGRDVAVLRPFLPEELLLFDEAGKLANLFSLEAVVAGVDDEVPIYSLALVPQEAYLLARARENAQQPVLWALNLRTGIAQRGPAPEWAAAVVPSSGALLVVDGRLGVWRRREK